MKRLMILALLCWTPALLGQVDEGQHKGGQAVSQERAETIVSALEKARPDLQYEDVESTPVEGIYRVQVEGGPVLYTTENANYMFVGDLYRVLPGQFVNVSEQDRSRQRRNRLLAVEQEDMIVFSPEGPRKAIVNVFTDVDCGYCRRFHQEVPELNDMGIEVRYLAFPRAGPGSSSFKKMVSAWCAKDKKQALTALKQGQEIEENTCADNPVEAQYRLGVEIGVTGTPALVLMDGTLMPGYRPAKDLARILGVR